MYSLISEHSFDAAHFLKGYEGKCSNIHGHRWRVVVEIQGDALKKDSHTRGMLIDFDGSICLPNAGSTAICGTVI